MNTKRIVESNGIFVPRERDYRLMADVSPLSEQEIADEVHSMELFTYEKAITSVPIFCLNSGLSEYSNKTEELKNKYLICKTVTEQIGNKQYISKVTTGFRWDLLHGKRRKALKFAVKKSQADVRKYYETFNQYAGRKDVLLVQARIGGDNWFINMMAQKSKNNHGFLQRQIIILIKHFAISFAK